MVQFDSGVQTEYSVFTELTEASDKKVTRFLARKTIQSHNREISTMQTLINSNLPKVANNPLVSRYLKDDISKTVAALVLIKTYATRISQQSEICLKIEDSQAIISNFNCCQTIFKQHANYLLNCLTPSLFLTVLDVIDYADFFQKYSQKFITIIPSIDQKYDFRYRFITLVNRLEKEVLQIKLNTQEIASVLHKFNVQFKKDIENFNSELKLVNQTLDFAGEEATIIPTHIKLINDMAEDFKLLFETTNYICEAYKAIGTEWLSILAGVQSFKREISRPYNMLDIAQIERNFKFASKEWNNISQRTQEMVVRVLFLKPEEVNKVLK